MWTFCVAREHISVSEFVWILQICAFLPNSFIITFYLFANKIMKYEVDLEVCIFISMLNLFVYNRLKQFNLFFLYYYYFYYFWSKNFAFFVWVLCRCSVRLIMHVVVKASFRCTFDSLIHVYLNVIVSTFKYLI